MYKSERVVAQLSPQLQETLVPHILAILSSFDLKLFRCDGIICRRAIHILEDELVSYICNEVFSFKIFM